MNSLAYLSRQFDVLAADAIASAAKTAPSTPTTERHLFIDDKRKKPSDSEASLPRVKTWSTKSFLFSPPPKSSPSSATGPKRSYSTPADFITLARTATLSQPAAVSLDIQMPPKSHLESLIGRIFFVRVLVLAWSSVRTAWRSMLELLEGPNVGQETVAPLREKDLTDDETVDTLTPPEPKSSYSFSISPPPSNPSSLVATRANNDLPPYDAESPPSSASSLEPPALDPISNPSRSSTPVLATRKTPFHLPKTLVLDLDETLIHSTSRPISSNSGSSFLGFGRKNKGGGHLVEVVLGGRRTVYHVYKRPFVDFFLRTVSGWYTLVIFTASMQEYADPVIDWLDAGRGILSNRLFRDSCTQLSNGAYTKDLSIIEPDLARVCLVDNSPVSYRVNEANGIPIEGWTHDPSDEALLDLLPVLDSLRFTSDVRRVLGLRSAGSS
ncbi:NLI interacting factor-like phosphatase-domain-containing protein [Mycena floridula]|nr:NLI interacting factor-like phosphatase-domain-containing protein [Mycena floridula]